MKSSSEEQLLINRNIYILRNNVANFKFLLTLKNFMLKIVFDRNWGSG